MESKLQYYVPENFWKVKVCSLLNNLETRDKVLFLICKRFCTILEFIAVSCIFFLSCKIMWGVLISPNDGPCCAVCNHYVYKVCVTHIEFVILDSDTTECH